jgi:SAM-dependent methyltransferase
MNIAPAPDAHTQPVNPFLEPDLAARYEQWYAGPGRRADRLEKRLLQRMLLRLGTVRTILEIGCGTGHFTRWMRSLNYDVVGLDSSPPMLEQARWLNGGEYQPGDALALPYPDQSFDVAALITTLEFVSDPERALKEAARVSRAGLLLGVINRSSLLARRYRRSGNPLWHSARFFTPFELEALVRKAAGNRIADVSWRTTLWPVSWVHNLPLPWGGFIGLAGRWKASTV